MVDFKSAVEQERRRLEVLHPTPEDVPGCMKLLDDFLSCHAIGPQLKSFYRYGGQSNCTHKRAEFQYCLGLRKLEPDERREQWIAHRAEWWASRRVGKSSEDVWDVRTEPPPDFPPARPIQNITLQHEIS